MIQLFVRPNPKERAIYIEDKHGTVVPNWGKISLDLFIDPPRDTQPCIVAAENSLAFELPVIWDNKRDNLWYGAAALSIIPIFRDEAAVDTDSYLRHTMSVAIGPNTVTLNNEEYIKIPHTILTAPDIDLIVMGNIDSDRGVLELYSRPIDTFIHILHSDLARVEIKGTTVSEYAMMAFLEEPVPPLALLRNSLLVGHRSFLEGYREIVTLSPVLDDTLLVASDSHFSQRYKIGCTANSDIVAINGAGKGEVWSPAAKNKANREKAEITHFLMRHFTKEK